MKKETRNRRQSWKGTGCNLAKPLPTESSQGLSSPRREPGGSMKKLLIVALTGGVLLALVVPTPADTAAEAAPSRRAQPNAVIALIDTGINPYHRVFRDHSPRAYRHPSTYVPGFPKQAEALTLSLDAPNYRSAIRRDCELWEKVEWGKLYWVPGTRIVGGISFERYGLNDKPPAKCENGSNFEHVNVLDGAGHGTMVASRAAGRGYGACQECLIVSVQGFNSDVLDWTGANSRWIDLQSNSWGPVLPLWEPTSAQKYPWVGSPELVRSIERAARRHRAFWSSGNGVGNRLVLSAIQPFLILRTHRPRSRSSASTQRLRNSPMSPAASTESKNASVTNFSARAAPIVPPRQTGGFDTPLVQR